MNKYKTLSFLLVLLAIVGCSAALVPYSNNPDEKLSQVQYLISVERYTPAERILKEALDLYIKKKDINGVAEAHFVSGMMNKKIFYNVKPENIEFKNTSVQRFNKAIKNYIATSDYMGEAKSYFAKANLYEKKQDGIRCTLYLKSKETYLKGKKINPEKEIPVLNKNYNNFNEMVTDWHRHFCE